MSGHGHDHDHDHVDDHDYPPLRCWASSFALENGLRPGAPRRRCACRGITEPLERSTLLRTAANGVSSGTGGQTSQ